ncbi:MAG: hypothetical protein JO348_09985 [Alphaproteobacteria bacterium]|nr:hypothetical protein [Alphaproteobacteria bacterium]MBV9420089.1 hypothetical protein [Alphaproteobacteria bacterium]MBV9542008.1 hypothetical protein [Alphaproteobacteria bacterium]MBV9904685.1 hypothetical protein [Alphaproteobacteria bacterium]
MGLRTRFLYGAIAAGALALSSMAALSLGTPGTLTRGAKETAQQFVERALGAKLDVGEYGDSLTETTWNGKPVIFATYVKGTGDDAERVAVLFEKQADGHYRKLDVTTGEQEGGTPEVKAIGFANADGDAAQEMIVLLGWEQQHMGMSGILYEVRIFDDASKPGLTKLSYLKKVSNHFDAHTCDCTWDDQPAEHFPFKTIALIKAELKKMGFK